MSEPLQCAGAIPPELDTAPGTYDFPRAVTLCLISLQPSDK